MRRREFITVLGGAATLAVRGTCAAIAGAIPDNVMARADKVIE